MKLIRVFPRRTRATPDDDLVRVGCGPGLFDEADEVHVSVTWTWDLPAAEELARQWEHVAPVKIGGPATGMKGEAFEPGVYVKTGYVISSRGCPNRCWFCSVWKRDGNIVRELPIRDGWNLLDDNILACSDNHIRAVFGMLGKQDRKAEFTGGLEAARLKDWHVDLLARLKPKQMFFAYDTPDDYEPLRNALGMLLAAGFTKASHALRVYVLCGFPKDSLDAADRRMMQVLELGGFPMAMLYERNPDKEWRRFQRSWARPSLVSMRSNAELTS